MLKVGSRKADCGIKAIKDQKVRSEISSGKTYEEKNSPIPEGLNTAGYLPRVATRGRKEYPAPKTPNSGGLELPNYYFLINQAQLTQYEYPQSFQ